MRLKHLSVQRRSRIAGDRVVASFGAAVVGNVFGGGHPHRAVAGLWPRGNCHCGCVLRGGHARSGWEARFTERGWLNRPLALAGYSLYAIKFIAFWCAIVVGYSCCQHTKGTYANTYP